MTISNTNDHVGAVEVIRQAWRELHNREPTPLETLYSTGIAHFETGYGRIGQFAKMAAAGKFNWGAVQKQPNADGTCPAGYEKGIDGGSVCFRVFPSDVEAAKNFLFELTKSRHRPGVVAAMQGTPEDVATAMRGTDLGKPVNKNFTSYYQGTLPTEAERIAAYATGIRTRSKLVADALEKAGRPLPGDVPFPQANISGGSVGGSVLVPVAVIGAAMLALTQLSKYYPGDKK